MSTSDTTETFEIPLAAAERYEEAFVPAFFAQWAPLLCKTAGVRAGQRVLDVACGTGIVARAAADIVGSGGTVVGLDLNEAMLTVARRLRPDLDWRQGTAEALPFADATFDVALSQMALMFFPNRHAAVREMARVVAGGGTVAVAVPAPLDRQPGFVDLVDVAVRHSGPEAQALLSTYFACGTLDEVTALVASVGLDITASAAPVGRYRSPSVEAMVALEVESTPLGERITEEQYRRILEDAHEALRPFTAADGSVDAPFETNIVAARRPQP
jgi:ubiquinone/menaquinone biosynthesis C-methylase UbiE